MTDRTSNCPHGNPIETDWGPCSLCELEQPTADQKLYESSHPYYCNEGNYYAPGMDQPVSKHKSWADFHEDQGDSDFDMNLVFRWDWKEEDDNGDSTYKGDDNYRNGKLFIFWMGQRKGLYRWSEIEVCRADEPAVRKWLTARFRHLLKLWEPFHV